ncbi:MAG: phosphate signaling complex protein PhoU [Chloracidobacterium sp.]|uniref:Phosphate-specific transport system accessory protein PhoU n=1 Tax=Chloracidobacterium validum TaxID=2821543 RepID=A0ABX8B7K2_9BACT|nr:phosphate signaling complex protein PhoU [Chloracidobacterium validum]QUW02932.1 phosphate signaling complex protein PhoU [Chloracidobacterium validum]
MDTFALDARVQGLREKVLLLGGQAEDSLSRSLEALIRRNSVLAEQVIRDDDVIDSVESEIDETCANLLIQAAQLSPADLRFVIGVLRTTPMIERIADHAVNIARHALRLNDEPELQPYIALPRMGDLVQKMLADALDALTQSNAAKARQTIRRDDEVDILYRRIFAELTAFMTKDSTAVVRAAELLFVIKHLERIADYATNVCEQVVYLAEGRAIKHTPDAWQGE